VKTEHVTIEIEVFRGDGNGSQDMDAVWNNLCDALYQIRGVERVGISGREVIDRDGYDHVVARVRDVVDRIAPGKIDNIRVKDRTDHNGDSVLYVYLGSRARGYMDDAMISEVANAAQNVAESLVPDKTVYIRFEDTK